MLSLIGLCYHLVNVISFSQAQSDHIKRLLLYYNDINIDKLRINKTERQDKQFHL